MLALHASDILQILKNKFNLPQFDQLIEKTIHIPPCSGNILEFHMERHPHWFDYAYRFNTDFDSPLLANELPLMQENNFPIVHLLQKLLNPESKLFHYGIQNIWIEEDYPFSNLPSIFFDLNAHKTFSASNDIAALEAILPIFNHSISPKLKDLVTVLAHLNLSVRYYGLMFSRSSRGIRMTISGISIDMLTTVLERLGWKAYLPQVITWQNTYRNLTTKLLVDIDFFEEVLPTIGVEIFGFSLDTILGEIQKSTIISSEQQRFIQDWEGILQLPDSIAESLSHLHQRHVSNLYTRINHIKFSFANHQITPKIYLYYCF